MYSTFTESAECPYHPWDERRVDPQELQEAGYLNAGGYGGVTDFEEDTFEEPAKKILTTFAQYQVLYFQCGEAHSSGEGGSKTGVQLVVNIQVSLLNRGHQ